MAFADVQQTSKWPAEKLDSMIVVQRYIPASTIWKLAVTEFALSHL